MKMAPLLGQQDTFHFLMLKYNAKQKATQQYLLLSGGISYVDSILDLAIGARI